MISNQDEYHKVVLSGGEVITYNTYDTYVKKFRWFATVVCEMVWETHLWVLSFENNKISEKIKIELTC